MHSYVETKRQPENLDAPVYADINKERKAAPEDTGKQPLLSDQPPKKTEPPSGVYDYLAPSQESVHDLPTPQPEELAQAPEDEEHPVTLDPLSPGVTDNPLYSGVTIQRTKSQEYEDHAMHEADSHPEIERRAYSDSHPAQVTIDFQPIDGEPAQDHPSEVAPQSHGASADQWSTDALKGSQPVTPEPEDQHTML